MTHIDDGSAVSISGLHETTRQMMSAESVDAIADIVSDAAKNLLDASNAVVYLDDDNDIASTSTRSVPESTAAECIALAQDAIGENVPLTRTITESSQAGVSAVGTGIGTHGSLVVTRDNPGSVSEQELEFIRILATNAEVAFDRAVQLRMLRERESELVDERNRLAALFENIPSPTASFVIEDDEPVVESVNPAFEDVFGFTEAELVGEKIDNYIVPPEREPEAEEYNDLLKEGTNINVEVRRLTASGPRDFLLDVVPFRLNQPNVHGYAMYTDITDRKRREQELERQNERLEQFASIVSHDIRNPLNVAQGFLEVAREKPDEEYFDRVENALHRVDDIVQSVLTLARQGRTVTESIDTNLIDTAEKAWNNVAMGTATLEHEVETGRKLQSDPNRLTTLFENLFRNARVHAGDSVTVTVGILPDETGFYVADDGPGIPQPSREKVLKSGYTTQDEGTGFGLAIVREVVEAHDWRIELGDQTDGARFEIRDVDWVEQDENDENDENDE